MGAMAEGLVAYMQPLIDETDGSKEQLNNALAIGQLCYNLALLPDDSREKLLNETRVSMEMDDEVFESFQRTIIIPMIERHRQMFPGLHRRVSTHSMPSTPSSPARQSELLRPMQPGIETVAETYPETDRYAPCPCNSGKKYKFCCGMKRH